MTIEQLKVRAQAYNVNEIYATEDGNFFYIEHKPYAEAHASQAKTKLHLIKNIEPILEEKPKRGRKTKNDVTDSDNLKNEE